MKAFICDKCRKNISIEVQVYHLKIGFHGPGENVYNDSFDEMDICKPCFDKMMGGEYERT